MGGDPRGTQDALAAARPMHVRSSRERIVDAARVEIENKGILGLRVQDVATSAGVSVPLIYKYFQDRDGLLADVLSRVFEELALQNIEASVQYFTALESPTVDDFLRVLAMPSQDWRTSARWLRAQILAASLEIPALRSQLSVVQGHINDRVVDFIRVACQRICGRVPVSPEALSLLVQGSSLGFVFNDLLDESETVSDEQYLEMLRALFVPLLSPKR